MGIANVAESPDRGNPLTGGPPGGKIDLMNDSSAGQGVDERLAAGFAERGLEDSRDAYRQRLRELKATHREAFERAVAEYETVRSRIEADEDAVDTWIEFGGMLAGLTDSGELLSIDPTGRAWAYGAPAPPDHMILFVPETGRAAFVAAKPLKPTAAQQATVELLVEGRLALR